MDGSSDTADDDETLETAIPQAEAFSAIYDTLLALADEELSSPVSASVDAWEDGTYLVNVFHHYAGAGKREVLRYHSAEDVVKYGVEDLEAETIETERTIDV